MKGRRIGVCVLVAACVLSLGSAALAAGTGQGSGNRVRLRDGSSVKNTEQNQVRQQLRDGSGKRIGTPRQGTLKGQKRQLGPGDGTGNVVPPKDGTGYGSPNTQGAK